MADPGNEIISNSIDEKDGNRIIGGSARAVLEHVAKSLVTDPEAVVVESFEKEGAVDFSLHVSPGDVGRVIGRQGRVAKAIRVLVSAAAHQEGVRATVDIVDD